MCVRRFYIAQNNHRTNQTIEYYIFRSFDIIWHVYFWWKGRMIMEAHGALGSMQFHNEYLGDKKSSQYWANFCASSRSMWVCINAFFFILEYSVISIRVMFLSFNAKVRDQVHKLCSKSVTYLIACCVLMKF